MRKNMTGYIYVPLLLSVLIVLGFVLSGGLILSEESPPVGEITEKYTLVEKEASPSSQTLQLSTLEFTAQDLTQVFPQVFCGGSGSYDIALVIDNSDSITNIKDYVEKRNNAMISFIDAFIGTSTQFSVTKFSETAEIVQPFTYDTNNVKNTINLMGKAREGSTNWEDGLVKTKETLDSILNRPSVPDFVVIATDGEPNRSGIDGFTDSIGGAVDKASLVADDIKENDAEIFALGIGEDLLVGAAEGIRNLIKITGSNPGYDRRLERARWNPKPDEFIILTDFDRLGADIAKVIVGICGP